MWRKLSYSILLCMFLWNCYNGKTIDDIGEFCVNYINVHQSIHPKEEVIFRLTEVDAGKPNIMAYRMYAQPPYVLSSRVPDSIRIVEKNVVLIYSLIPKGDKSNIFEYLNSQGFISDMALKVTSNYAEWILLVDTLNGKSKVYKDSGYKNLDDFINDFVLLPAVKLEDEK
ncbi:MAG: hypothetical protein R2795_26890 [Saprospiraceae bacterium]